MKILKILLSIILFIILLFFIILQPVDIDPYFNSEYYKTSIARLDSLSQSTVSHTGQLQAGFAKVNLTPKFTAASENSGAGRFTSLPLAGYGGREGAPTRSVHDSIFVKCIALQVNEQAIYLVATDLLIVPQEVQQACVRLLSERHGISREQLYFSATHSHSSIGGWGEGLVAEAFAGPFDARVRAWIDTCIVKAGNFAQKDLAPARWGFASFRAPSFNRNRLVGKKGRVNSRFDYLYFDRADGKKAVLGIYGAHATVLSDDNMQCSGDYPGYWQRAVEEKLPGSTALFFAGSVGSHRPAGQGSGFKRAENSGRALADSVVLRLGNIELQNQVTFNSLTLPLQLPPIQIRLFEDWRLRPFWGHKLMPIPPAVSLQTLQLDNFILATTPCDFSGELALRIHDTLQQKGKHTAISSFNGDYVGYIIPGKYYHFPKYEPRLMGWFGPYMGSYATEMLLRMMGSY